MNIKRSFVDIYSHSNSSNNKNSKSRGRVKNALCFLLCVIILFGMIGFYYLGAKVEQSNNNSAIGVTNAPQKHTESRGNVIIDDAINSVVGIYVYNDTTDCYGSGVAISHDGYIVTADHLFKNINSPKIIVYDSKGEYYKAAFIGGDLKSDIAVIKIEKTDLTFSNLTSVDTNVGDKVYSISCPMDKSLSMSVTSGIVSGVDRRFKTENGTKSLKCIQTDAPINPGSSGGGLFNSYGDLIGINCSKIVDESYEGVAFAIPSQTLIEVVTDIINYGKCKSKADLGIEYECVDYTTALKSGVNCGLYINKIYINSGLYGLGIKEFDTILSINDVKIYEEDVFLNILEESSVGDKVKLVISNSYNQFEVYTTLIEYKSKTNYVGWINTLLLVKNTIVKEGYNEKTYNIYIYNNNVI